ncbi:uncharacterized protein [Chelonus insularis]|uniref:uncharacterized protein isoform X2 n=1 Tax=Chelonus insularis TaxID=460826 RepID=UPI001588BC35|nr:uncharacterized protein LOC118069693 isoform X2 [Chelonus insularis]
MDQNEKCWLQCQVNSMPQVPGGFSNVVTENNPNNFQQQHQRNQQQQQPRQTYSQPVQTSPCGGFSMNQNTYYQNPAQMDSYMAQPAQHSAMAGNSPLGAGFPYSSQLPYNVTTSHPPLHPSQFTYGSPAQATALEQFRAYLQAPSPIFILPNNPSPVLQIPQTSQVREQSFNCPGVRETCPNLPQFCCPPACIPYPYPMPMFNPFVLPSGTCKETSCCSPRRPECRATNYSVDDSREHKCENANDDTICTRINCPSAISLQALASQLLSIQGVISCVATRLVLRKVPGSNITNTMEETVERARKTIETLNQDQLLAETRNAQQVNALINLHMAANPPSNIIPILTTIQLKVNLLKSHIESLINRRISENQGAGAECSSSLDPVILTLKSDEELRTLLATLRQKECDQRVNLNFAPYHSQRVIAETRLKNVQDKIAQVEAEMERRRNAAIPQFRCQEPYGREAWHVYPGTLPTIGLFRQTVTSQPQNFKSPDPFQIEVRNPRRLNLQPHVGSPETTYRRLPLQMKEAGSSTDKPTTNTTSTNNLVICDQNDSSDNLCSCGENKSSDEEIADADKKKLHQLTNQNGHVVVIGINGEVVELTPGVVVVINNPQLESKKGTVKFAQNDALEIVIDNKEKSFEENPLTDENINNNHHQISTNPDSFKEETVQMITDVKYGAKSVAMSFETLYSKEEDKSMETGNKNELGKKNSSNMIMNKKNIPSESESKYDIEKYFKGFLQRDSKDSIKGKSEKKEILYQELVQDESFEMNEIIDSISSSCEDNFYERVEKKNKEARVEKNEISYKRSEKSTLNPFSLRPSLSTQSNNEGTLGNFVSGALSVIGNHVASFGSIIDKITALKPHLVLESSHALFDNNSKKTSNKISHSDVKKLEDNGEKSYENSERISRQDEWTHNTFPDYKNYEKKLLIDLDPDEIIIPRMNRVIIKDETNKKTYILIKRTDNAQENKLEEFYKPQRSLLIRSRLKNSQSTSEEQQIPFTIVTLPKCQEKSVILSSNSLKSNQSNRCILSHILKSSEKFWSRSKIKESTTDEETEINAADSTSNSSPIIRTRESSFNELKKLKLSVNR